MEDDDLGAQSWDELGELLPKESPAPSALHDFQVRLNGELALSDSDLPLPDPALADPSVRLDAALNPVQQSRAGSPITSPAARAPTPAPAPGAGSPRPQPARASPMHAPASPAKAEAALATAADSAPAPASASPAAPTAGGRVEKRGGGALRAKRAREAARFPRALLGSLDGTTSADVRKMSAGERELVMYKRKLRNRESARRSRARRQATVAELQGEIGDLLSVAAGVVDAGLALRADNDALRGRLDLAHAEIRALRAVYVSPDGPRVGPAQTDAGAAEEEHDDDYAASGAGLPPPDAPLPPPNASDKLGALEDDIFPHMMQMGG